MSKHESHPEIVKRLRRAHGHLAKVIDMIENGVNCAETAQQLHAVTNALSAAKTLFVQDHIEHCFEDAIGLENKKVRNALEELKTIAKFL